jgi:hypothetical protein
LKATLIKAIWTIYEAPIRGKEYISLQARSTIIGRNPAFTARLQAWIAYPSTCIVTVI